MGPFRLVGLDVDGTLTNSAGQVTPAVREAVAATVAAGVEVVIATAREPAGAQQVADQLGVPVGAVMVNGALVAPGPRATPWALCLLPAATAREAVRVSREHGLAPVIWHDPRQTPGIVAESPVGWQPGFVREQGDRLAAVPDLLAWLRQDVLVVTVTAAEAPIRELAAALATRLDGPAAVTFAPYPPDEVWVINVYAAGCDKWRGLQRYARERGVADEAVLAVGDGYNDLPMLRGAGCGVAMGNALPDVRAAADLVVADHDHDGVAEALRRCILGKAANGEVRR